MAASSLDAFLWAIGQEESGGNYNAHNPGGAIGKYQVMPSNVANWTQQALGQSLTPSQFAASPSAQEAVAKTILGGYYQKYGPAGAAAMWFSGQPDPNSTASDGNTTVRGYVANVISLMGRAPASAGGGSVTSATLTQVDSSSSTGGKPPDCLFGFSLPVVGYTCILTKGQGRAVFGALLIGAGGIVGGAGLIILASYGLKSTGALEGVAKAAAVVPGAGGLAARAADASGALKRPPKGTAERRRDREQKQGGA